MTLRLPSPENLSLQKYLTISIVITIVGVAGFLAGVSYLATRDEILAENAFFRNYTEQNAIDAVTLADTGLRLYDGTLNDRMEEAFGPFISAYNAKGGALSEADLRNLEKTLQTGFTGNLDLYIINESGIITVSTVPEVLGLDFRPFPEYYAAITKIRQGDSFSADRVVRSVTSAEDGTNVSGTYRKFAFMPVPDHRVLLEMGLEDDAFFTERADLSYQAIAEGLKDLNPNLASVIIVDSNGVIVSAPVTVNGTETDDPGVRKTLQDRAGHRVTFPDGNSTTYLFANLSDPSSASDMSLVIRLDYTDTLLDRRLRDLMTIHLVIALAGFAMGVVFAYGTSRFLTKPLEGIIEDVDTIARGDLDHPIRSGMTPEFTRLRESITLMISRIRKYSGELERERTELRIASTIQTSFLPKTIPEIEGFSLAAVSIPAKEVGGDFYDIIDLGDGRTGLVIADVSGKGVPAALFMVFSRTVLRASTRMIGVVSGTVTAANRMIAADADLGMFVTLFFGVIDPGTRKLAYTNAGHNPPIHYHAASGTTSWLAPCGMAVGVDGDLEYRELETDLEPGDTVVFYTDGVTEAENPDLALFGDERLEEVVRRNPGIPPAELIDRIRGEIRSFAGDAPQSDDITIMVLRAE